MGTDDRPVHVGWLNLDGEWARAFETREPETAFWRLLQEQYKAGARSGRILPAGVHPKDAPAPAAVALPAGFSWQAGEGGGPPAVNVLVAVGWLLVGGRWERACADPDMNECVRKTAGLCAARGAGRWAVLPEGREPRPEEEESPRG